MPTRICRAGAGTVFFLTGFRGNAKIMACSHRFGDSAFGSLQLPGAHFLFAEQSADRERGVQQGGQVVAEQRQGDADGAHRAEAGTGAGEFHEIISFL